ncbi:hypothetical protein C8J56DRAFT_934782 [Mycena floridula]|nr:hypothetical protein C8J56DRAFT_934782 [Mycena floridula]
MVEIPESEQWRLINESGILKKDQTEPPIDAEPKPLAQEILEAIFFIVPFSFLLLMMEILIHFQYNQKPSLETLFNRMISGVPIMSIFIFYTLRYKHYRKMQFFLFVLSTLVGPRMIYLLNHASWLVNMRQCPPLATIWIYAIVQLDLGPAVLSLVMAGIYVVLKGLKVA